MYIIPIYRAVYIDASWNDATQSASKTACSDVADACESPVSSTSASEFRLCTYCTTAIALSPGCAMIGRHLRARIRMHRGTRFRRRTARDVQRDAKALPSTALGAAVTLGTRRYSREGFSAPVYPVSTPSTRGTAGTD